MASNIRTVIEITDTHVKLLQAKRGAGKSLVVDFDACSLDGKLDEDIQAVLLQMIRARSIDSDNFIIVLPRRLTSIKRLRIPSLDDNEIRKMLPLQISHMLPHVLDDLVYAYEILEKEKSGYAKVIIYIVHKDVCDRYTRIFDHAKVLPSKYILSSLGIAEWFCAQKDRQGGAPTLLLNLDLRHTEACFIHKNRLLFSRIINYGITNLHKEILPGFADQVEQSVRLYRKEGFGEDITKILVISSAQDMSEIAKVLEERFHVPLETCSPSEGMNAADPAVKNRILEYPGLSLTVCLGLVGSESKNLINLIAKHVQNVKDADVKRKQIFHFMVAAFSFWVVFLCAGSVDLIANLASLKKIKEQVSVLNSDAKKARNQVGMVDAIDEYLAKGFSFSGIIVKLYQIIPPDISLRSMNINRTGNMVIGGYAQSGAAVNLFQSRLVASAEFSDVTLQFTAKRKLYNQELVEFKMQFKLKR